MKRIFRAFTLAEVLITLSLIGVVAALSLPALQINIERQGLNTQVSKFYANYENSMQRYMMENDITDIDSIDFNVYLNNYFSGAENCSNNLQVCFAQQYRVLNGNVRNWDNLIDFPDNPIAFRLKDGTTIAKAVENNIIFDVNGLKGPNTLGLDFFVLQMDQDASPIRVDVTEANINACRDGSGLALCLGLIIKNNFRFPY